MYNYSPLVTINSHISTFKVHKVHKLTGFTIDVKEFL